MAMLYSEKQIDEAHEGGIWSCQWTQRDEIVTASNDQTCAIWDASTGALKHTLKDCGQGAVSIVSDRTGDILASSQIDCHIKVWDASTGTCKGTIDTGKIDGVVDAWTLCSDGGSELVSGTNHGSVNCWDLTTLKKTATHKVSEDAKAFVLSVGRHEDIVATASYDGQLRTVDLRSGACTTFSSKDREDPVRSLCFVRGGSGLLFASDDGSVRYFDRRKPDHAAYTMYCAQSWCMSVRASPDGKHFCTSGADRLVKFWDLDEKREVARVDGHTDQVWDVAYSPDGSRLVSVADDGRVRFHDKERADVALRAHDEEVAAEKRKRAEDAAAMDVEGSGVDGVDVSSLPPAPPASFLREAAKWATI